MRENEFERKVQEQMEELRLRPSEEIWPKVEEELKRKKRRRVGFFIFLLAGLGLLGYSGYTLLHQDSTTPVAQTHDTQNTSAPANNQTSTNTNTAVAQHEKTPTQQPSAEPVKTSNKEVYLQPNDKNDITGSDVTKNAEKQNDQQHDQTIHTEVNKTKPSGNDKKNQMVRATQKPPQQVQPIEVVKNHTVVARTKKEPAKNKVVKKDKAVINAGNQKIKQVDEPSIDIAGKDPAAKKDIAAVHNDPVKNILTAQPSLDSVAGMSVAQDSAVASLTPKQSEELLKDSTTETAVNKKKSSSKIKFGVEFSGGISSSRKDLIGLNNDKSILADNLLPQAPGAGTNGPQRIIIPPSIAKSGNGFRIGLVAEKKISARSSITSSLRYTYMNEHIKVGSYKDTVIFSNSYQSLSYIGRGLYSGAAYANGSVRISNYTNKYHFLEIPIQYQLQLNKSKSKLPVQWNVGLTAGYLLSTNAVVYDTAAGGIYYRNKDAFKRFHASFQTGLSFLFGAKKKIQWSLGPDISLDMTRLMKEDVFTRKRYLLYTGITGKIFFSKKKQ